MGSIRDAFNSAWPDGPSSSPASPDKAVIRNAGGVVEDAIAAIAAIAATGVQWKTAVRAASTANVTLSAIANGATFGGVTVATGDRIAPIGQTAGAQNGIYVVQASGSPVRATDADAGSELVGAAFYVIEGTHGGKQFLCTTTGTINVGTTALSFVPISDQTALNATLATAVSNIATLTTRADQRAIPVRPLVVDGTKLLIPGFFLWDKGSNAALPPTDGSLYWEVDLPSDGVRWWYLNAATPSAPIVQVDLDANPKTDGAGRILIAYCINGQVTSDFPIITAGGGERGESQWDAGKYPDAASFFSQTTTAVVTANAALQALGFSRAVADATAANLYYGGDMPEITVGANYGFARVWVYSSTADDFGTEARVNFFRGGANGTFVGQRNLSLEKKISSNLAIYSAAFDISASGLDFFNVGITQTAAGRNQIVAQVSFSRRPIYWLSRTDFPPDPMQVKPVIGRHLWMISGRPLPIYPQNLFGQMTDDRPASAGFWSVRAEGASYPHLVSGDRQIMIDPDLCGPTGYLEVRRKGMRGRRNLRDIVEMAVHRADPVTKTVKVLLIGDSLTNRRMAARIARKLTALDITPQWIGTLPGSDSDVLTGDAYINDASGPLGEGRDGWKIAEFINLVATWGPAASDWASYNSGTKAYKHARNPFLRAATGGDAASGASQIAYNGYVFDLAYYLSQTSQATPDVILIGLGTNDMFQAGYLSYMSNGLRVMLSQCRAAAPAARIGWWFPINPVSDDGLSYRPKAQAIIRQSVAQIVATGDANIFEVPVWASLDPDMGWRLNTATPDAAGVKTATLNDVIHLGLSTAPIREQAAEVLAAFIAA